MLKHVLVVMSMVVFVSSASAADWWKPSCSRGNLKESKGKYRCLVGTRTDKLYLTGICKDFVIDGHTKTGHELGKDGRFGHDWECAKHPSIPYAFTCPGDATPNPSAKTKDKTCWKDIGVPVYKEPTYTKG